MDLYVLDFPYALRPGELHEFVECSQEEAQVINSNLPSDMVLRRVSGPVQGIRNVPDYLDLSQLFSQDEVWQPGEYGTEEYQLCEHQWDPATCHICQDQA